MRSITPFFIVMLVCSDARAQAPDIEWQKALGGTADEFGSSLEPTNDGGYIVVGSTESTNGNVTGQHGGFDVWVVKLDALGTIQWQKALGGSEDDYGLAIKETSDQGYVVSGSSYSSDGDVSSNQGGSDLWVAKLDAAGTLQWQQSYGGSNQEVAYDILQTTDGGYIVAGETNSNNGDVSGNHGFNDMWVIRLDASGAMVWQRTLGSTGIDLATAITEAGDGGYVVAGSAGANDGDVTGYQGGPYDCWLVKLDGNGQLQWQKAAGGSGFDSASGIVRTNDSGFAAVCSSDSNDGDVTGQHGSYDHWVIKLNASGDLQWQSALGGSGLDSGGSILESVNGDLVVAGRSESVDGDVSMNFGGSDVWVVRLSGSGSLLWEKSLGGTVGESATAIKITTDGGYAFVGTTNSNDGHISGNHGARDIWVVKLETDYTAVEEYVSSMDFGLYPNPTSGELSISFSANAPSMLSVDILDASGRLFSTVQLPSEVGSHRKLYTGHLVPGAYVLRVATNSGTVSRPFLRQ